MILLMVAITMSVKVSRAQADEVLTPIDCLSTFLSAYRETNLWCGYESKLDSCSTHDVFCNRSATNCQKYDAFHNATVVGEVRFRSVVLMKTIKNHGFFCSCEQYTFSCVIMKDEGSCYSWLTTGGVLFGSVMVICVAIILYRKFSILCKKNIISEIKMDTFHRADTDGTAKIISKTDKVSIPNGGKGPESKDVDDYDYIYEEQGKEEEEEETSYMYSCYDRNVLKIRSNLYSTE